jgi:hypothetical protein
MAINSPNVLMLDSEDVSVTRVGSWGSVGDAEAVGGSYLQSNNKDNYLQFSFKGSALWIRFKFGGDCGKASITIDGKAYPIIDLYSDLAVFKYVNVAVGLDENVSHTVKIGVDGTKNASSTDYYVNVDAFMYRTTEEALSLQNIEYIDLINVINTINRINEIKIISNIANIDLVKEISNVDNVANILNIRNISNVANVSLIQKISLIQELSALGKIYTISDVLGISNVGTIGKINTISDILGISNIGKIANISNIQNISNVAAIRLLQYAPLKRYLIANGDFETGDLSGWSDATANVAIDSTIKHRGSYSCKLPANNWIKQLVPRIYGDTLELTWWDYRNVGGDTYTVIVWFTDGTSESTTVTPITGAWDSKGWKPTTHKLVSAIQFWATATNTGNIWIDDIYLEAPIVDIIDRVNQLSTVNNLLNPHPISLTPESKLVDANQFSGTFSPTAAGSTTIISAVSGKVIRIYDFSLWNSGSADVTVELYFGTSGKRLYKGLLSPKTGVLKTYVRPWESNAGDSLVLALSAAGTCNYCIGAVQA